VPHVGVERFCAGDGQDDAAHGDECRQRLRQVELQGVQRIEHLKEDLRVLHDVHSAQHRQGQEVDQHDWPEQRTDPGRAVGLDREQADEDSDRGRDDIGFEAGLDGGQPLDRRQDRDGRRDHAVTIE
jgi:hypothetical protein